MTDLVKRTQAESEKITKAIDSLGYLHIDGEKAAELSGLLDDLLEENKKLRNALTHYADPEYNGYNADNKHALLALGNIQIKDET